MRYRLVGLDCPNCANKLEVELRKIKGLEKVNVNFTDQTVDLPSQLADNAREIISRVEPGIKLTEKEAITEEEEGAEERKQLYLLSIAGILLIIGFLFNTSLHETLFSWAEYAVFLPSFIIVGWPVIVRAGQKIIRGELFDESFLMSVATIGAIAVHQLTEAVAVMLFYAVGEYFQERAVNRSKRSIKALLQIKPEYANVKKDGTVKQVNPEAVAVGETIIVKPGEKVPLDGKVLAGNSLVDTSALTGESVPREIGPGADILAGMINNRGVLEIKVTKVYQESSVAKILKLVEEANERKAPTERFMTVFAHYYTPVVVFAALILALLPPIIIPGATFDEWIYRALILLVISCPCALMVSIPLGYFGGIGTASRRGILIKGANYLDLLAKVNTVVFDKTGTLTKGVFKVSRVAPSNGFSEEEVLKMAAAVEAYSNHPIAQSIQEAYQGKNSESQVKDYQEIPGYGISALVNGKQIIIGNDRLLHFREVEHDTCNIVGTNVHVVVDDIYTGYIIIADEIREEAVTAIKMLKQLGIKQTVMLTGDEESVAGCTAEKLGIDRFYAQLMPGDKVKKLEALSTGRDKVAFIGDGINDAPVITRADVGIAMGGLGSDAAIEAADVVLMEDNPAKVVTAIKIARHTRKIVYQNIILALGVKLFFVFLGTLGVATIWEAVFADVGVALLAVLNATRGLGVK